MKNTDTQVNYEIVNEMAFIICLGAVPREVNKKRDLSTQTSKTSPKGRRNSPVRYPRYRKRVLLPSLSILRIKETYPGFLKCLADSSPVVLHTSQVTCVTWSCLDNFLFKENPPQMKI